MGIVALREVEIRRVGKDGKGERTDIYIAGQVRRADDTFDVVRVIVEVKGCWHEELKKAMRTQLTDPYLHENDCSHGIYLVGWFNCEKWDKTDTRRDKSRKWSLDEAKNYFATQSDALSDSENTIQSFVLNCAWSDGP